MPRPRRTPRRPRCWPPSPTPRQTDPLLLLAASATDMELSDRALMRVMETAEELCAEHIAASRLDRAYPIAQVAMGFARASLD